MSEDASQDRSAYPHTMRLQRFLARAGVSSRRGAESLMTAGRVAVNGKVASELGTKVDVDRDVIEVDGERVRLADGSVFIMLDKPAGYLTTMSDPYGRPCVAELVPTDRYPGLFPVGRLDMDTTGLLIFTTDGDAAQRLLHPSHHVAKRYIALVDGHVRDRDLEPLRRGMTLDDGPCKPAGARLLDASEALPAYGLTPGPGTSLVEVVLSEGRKNQVKRMLSAVRHPVLRLHRASFGPIELDGVGSGRWRLLSDSEISAILEASRATEGAR